MKSINLTPELYEYVCSFSKPAHDVLKEVKEYTESIPYSQMMISEDQGAFMHWLAGVIGARKALEIGLFTGYSAISVAAALPDDGKLISLELDKERAQRAEQFFQKASLGHKIDVKIGPALDSLDDLISDGQQGTFDLAFIDADKENLIPYYEKSLTLLRQGGVLLVDNVLWSGAVVDDSDQSSSKKAICTFNQMAHEDPRTEGLLLNLSDGIFALRKL